jgi:predicted DNA-binding transcriptional regulator AlpA
VNRRFQSSAALTEQPQRGSDLVLSECYLTAQDLVVRLALPNLKAVYRFLADNPSFPRLRLGKRRLRFHPRMVDAWMLGELSRKHPVKAVTRLVHTRQCAEQSK